MKIRFNRTFWPIGHGAFYSERFYDSNENVIFTAVYDCGSEQEKVLNNCIDAFLEEGKTIDILFLSHFHHDHVSGLKKLLSKDGAVVKNLVIPQLTDGYVLCNLCSDAGKDSLDIDLVRKLHSGESLENVENIYEVVESEEGYNNEPLLREMGNNHYLISGPVPRSIYPLDLQPLWEYIPYNGRLDKQLDLVTAFEKGGFIDSAGNFDITQVYSKLVSKEGIKEVKNIYRKVISTKDNEYSMPVFSGLIASQDGKVDIYPNYNCYNSVLKPYFFKAWHHELYNCVYTGDFEPKAGNDRNLVYYLDGVDKAWDRTQLLQVPHHGSKNNISERLYIDVNFSIISAAVDDKYDHPDVQTILALQEYGTIYWEVTDKATTAFVQRYIIEI